MFYNGSDYYFTKNLFGDIIKVVKSDGTVVAQYSYDTWGKCTVETNVDGMADKNPFRYRGYYYDVESGLYYLQTRYYSPEFRRFISPDNYDLLPTLAESGDLNLYAYCSNNPVMYTDPTGEFGIGVFLVIILGAVVGGTVKGIVEYNNGVRGWELVGEIFLGAGIGMAVAGAAVSVISVGASLLGCTSFLGMPIAQATAWGMLAYNTYTMIIAPIYGYADLIPMEMGSAPEPPIVNPTPPISGMRIMDTNSRIKNIFSYLYN